MLVAERTADLQTTHERLRFTERLAAVGTLAAGLGHDMGNLLLPLRMRLDALERTPLPEDARKDVRAIGEACEYLKRLSQGLRLFALNPEDSVATGDRTDLKSWWGDVATFLQNVLPRGVELEAGFPPDLPEVAISAHGLSQVIYNLVQNAGDAMRPRGRGHVSVSAQLVNHGGMVAIEVSDDGPGMTDEVARRCLEPFFTTKARGISTGLGLALVHGAMRKVRGSVDVRSRLGEGTTFRLLIPAAVSEQEAAGTVEPRLACVNLADERVRAYVQAELRALNVTTTVEPWSPRTPATLLVIDQVGERNGDLAGFLGADPQRTAIVLGESAPGGTSPQVRLAGDHPSLSRIRRLIREAVRPRALEEVTS
jgi:anti-sigma regulatory factor (Ser/Thr protein kinase)